MPTALDIENFLELSATTSVILDVRTSAEFAQGHIPGAVNLPLFSNEERVVVGILYKQKGKHEAIAKGLEFVGPRMASMASEAQALAKNNTLFINCWRGGMRSGSVAWLMELYGVKVYTLKGGYKYFRRFVLDSFTKKRAVYILGGNTGSGKTEVLEKLVEQKQQVIDLEKLAHHKGSVFGTFGQEAQPTQEQFENELGMQLFNTDVSIPVWLEDESRLIGKKVIPLGLWEQMREANVYHLNISFEERVAYLMKAYGTFSKEQLSDAIQKITKRLGHQQAKNALLAIEDDDIKTACAICLAYYDKSYEHGMQQRETKSIIQVACATPQTEDIAKQLISLTQQI